MNIFVGAHSLNSIPDRFSHRVGNLFTPGGFWNNHLQFALDNYVFSAWKKQQEWSEDKFFKHLETVLKSRKTPRWVVVPDAVGDSSETLAKWQIYSSRLRSTYGWDLAFAVQDGATVNDVPSNADIVFVGGTTQWKRQTIQYWCNNFPRVHVARVNTYRWLWHCHKCGAESIDGTGWFWRNKREHQDLLDYLSITEGEKDKESNALFPLHPYNNPFASGIRPDAKSTIY